MQERPRTVAELSAHVQGLGARAPQVRLLLGAWLRGIPLAAARGPRSPRLAHSLEAALAELQTLLDGLVREIVRHPGSDGSARLLLRLSSDRTIEAVELPRDGLCVSTQVGCAVGCRFCKT